MLSKVPSDSAHKLREGIAGLKLVVSRDQQELLLNYLSLLQKWNKAYNLTAVRDPNEMLVKHVLDSLAIVSYCRSAGTLLDLGAGAGLPSVVLAIVCPEMGVWALDSNIKKTRFMQQVAYELSLNNLRVIHARADSQALTQTFDIVISRAFAALSDYVQLALPRLNTHGQIFAMKGRYPESELAEAAPLCDIKDVIPLSVPFLEEDRHLIIAGAMSSTEKVN